MKTSMTIESSIKWMKAIIIENKLYLAHKKLKVFINIKYRFFLRYLLVRPYETLWPLFWINIEFLTWVLCTRGWENYDNNIKN